MNDGFNLQRFIEAQNPVYEKILDELGSGQKRGHWMWFTFPQIKGLGSTLMAQKFAISCRLEAQAYLNHALLGNRLRQCTQLVLNLEEQSIEQIFAYPDDLKFRSCMTLFASSGSADNRIFNDALQKYFAGKPDQLTLDILKTDIAQ